MKRIEILMNHLDDCLLYVDGVPYNDIDYRDVEGIMLLKEILKDVADINLRKTRLSMLEFPDLLQPIFDYQI